MANAPIPGLLATLTFPGGYTTNGYAWIVNFGATLIENTPFTPTNNWTTRDTGVPLKNWGGSYRCHTLVTTATTIAGPAYLAFPYAWDLTLTCEPHEVTAFTATDRDYIGGLLDCRGSYDTYLDTDTGLVTAGEMVAAVFTLAAGQTYAGNIGIEGIDPSVGVDGAQRSARVTFASTDEITEVGVPIPGATGVANFTSHTNRIIGGDPATAEILVTSINISVNAERTAGDITIWFVGKGTCPVA